MTSHWMAGGAVILCCVGSWTDLRTRRIPNMLTFPALVVALCLHGALGAGHGLFLSACGALAAGGLLLPGYLLGFTGAGDIKLLMAVGAFLSFPLGLHVGLVALFFGGLLGLLTALFHGRLGEVLVRTAGLARWLAYRAAGAPMAAPETSKLRIPFGAAIALAALTATFVPGLGGAP